MKTHASILAKCLLIPFLGLLFACAPASNNQPAEREAAVAQETEQVRAAALEVQKNAASRAISAKEESSTSLPVRFQTPAYLIKDPQSIEANTSDIGEFTVKVGADISSTSGPVPLRDILKRMAAMKNMNVSWASDVSQYDLVDVDIRADDDFFGAIDNILRQRDYFHEVQGNTIIVKYKETRKFHIAMPFTSSSFSTGIGGDVLGSSGSSTNIKGNLQLNSDANKFDIWENIRTNLDKVLQIWSSDSAGSNAPTPASVSASSGTDGEAAPVTATTPRRKAIGYYTIDKPIGLITVTAPRVLLEKVDNYIKNLKEELYKQISIEAKILEVTTSNAEKSGIDWGQLLDTSAFDMSMNFGNISASTPLGDNRVFTLNSKGFSVFLSALNQQGKTKVLANPRISVMNGQPAVINVGENVTYIESVTSTVDEGVITYSVNTSSVMSGLGLAVIATLIDDNNIILNLTPVTSKLDKPIEYKFFGGANQVGLPVVNLREMSTIVRVKNGEMLVVGGLIDSSEDTDDNQVPLLGKLPILKHMFGHKSQVDTRKELIILLKPTIISLGDDDA